MDDDEEDSVWMESLHDPRNFQRLAGLLRDWADKLLNGRPVDTEEERVQFECQIGWVEQQADLLNAAAYGQKESFGRRGFQKRYKLDFLLRCFLLCTQLSNVQIAQVPFPMPWPLHCPRLLLVFMFRSWIPRPSMCQVPLC